MKSNGKNERNLARLVFNYKNMFQWNMSFRKPEDKRLPFELTLWMDTFNSSIWNSKIQLAQNIDFSDRWFKPRKWETAIWSWSAWSPIYWIWVVKREAGDVLWRFAWNELQYFDWTEWEWVIAWYSLKYWSMVSFDWPDYSNSALKTWTATWWNKRALFATWLTESLYVSKFLLITSWTWVWQIKLITSNTATEIFIEWTFDIEPNSTSVYAVRWREWHIYASNWTDNFTRINWQDWNPITTAYVKKFHYMTVAHNRIFACRNDEDILWFSDLWTANFWKDNFILLDPDWDKITWIVTNQDRVIIYKQHSRFRLVWSTPEFFELVKSDSNKWAIAPRSICSWNNYQFFLSEDWIEMYNVLESSNLEEWLPISYLINPTIQSISQNDRKNAVGSVIWNKMMMSIGTRTFVYDMEQSSKKQTAIWSVYDYAFNISAVLQWQMYFAISGIVYRYNKNEIISTANKNIKIETQRFDFKDQTRQKNIYRLRLVFEKANATTNITIKTKYDWWSENTIITQDIAINPEINIVINRICKDIQVNIESTTNKQFEFLYWEFTYDYITKI